MRLSVVEGDVGPATSSRFQRMFINRLVQRLRRFASIWMRSAAAKCTGALVERNDSTNPDGCSMDDRPADLRWRTVREKVHNYSLGLFARRRYERGHDAARVISKIGK